jgi:replicative DNA helicase
MAILTDRKGKKGTGDPLIFSDTKQEALLGHALTNRMFFLQIHNHLEPEWFTKPNNQKLYSALKKFYTVEGRFPQTPVELMSSTQLQREDQGSRTGMAAALILCQASMPDFGDDLLIKDFGLWARSVLLEEYVQKSTETFNGRNPEEALDVYKEGYRKIQTAELLGGGQATDWNLEVFVAQQKSDLQNGITFGCPQLDAKLNPSAPAGALLRGDTTVVLAPSGTGKTTTLITVATHNILRGKSVLFITHEGRPEDIKFKILCCILQTTREEFLSLYSSSKSFRRKANYFSNAIKANLTYIAFNHAFASIHDVERLIRREQDLRILSSSNGQGYDLLIDDYPALLYTDGLRSGQLQKRISDEQVYGCFVSMALDFGFHCLVAIQTNREGSKVNRGQGVNRLLTMEDVMESWGVMTKATNVLTINRSPTDMAKNRVIFYLCKSRSSETDFAFCCKSDYSRATTHAPAGWPYVAEDEVFTVPGFSRRPEVDLSRYGCTAWAGHDGTTERLDSLIDAYRGQTIPDNAKRAHLAGPTAKPMVGSGDSGQKTQIVVQSVS